MNAESVESARNGVPRPPVLGITLDTMWSIKDYVLSGALKSIAQDFPVLAWVSQNFFEGTAHLLAATRSEGVTLRPFRTFTPSKAFSAVCKLQKSLRYERYDVATEQVKKRRRNGAVMAARSPVLNGVAAATRLIAKSPLGLSTERMLALARRRLVPADLYVDEFTHCGIQMVMTTDPTKRDEDPIYFEAKRRSIPVTTLVLSWDNLTSKGIIHPDFDTVMVWNDVMREEMALMYPGYRGDQVRVVGFPRFDVYGTPFPPRFERGPFLRSLNLDPERPVLLFASSGAAAFRAQWDVVEHICEALERGQLGLGVQLLIRCHPHDQVQETNRFRGRADVVVWPEPDRGRAGTLYSQLPDAAELLVLCASVAHSAVLITAGSSLMLDAARADVPIVCVAYDGNLVLTPEDSVASVYGYSHQKPLHDIGATVISHSRDELIAAIRMALAQPSLQKGNRERLVNRYLGGYGSSIDRIRTVLSELPSFRAVMR